MRTARILVATSLAAFLLCGCSSTAGRNDGGNDRVCSACAQTSTEITTCGADVATAASCPSPGTVCCAGGTQWHCGNCIAETCHWFQSCTPADFDGGGRCSDTVSCPSGQVCIVDGTCAERCSPDGGVGCASGTTCQTASWYFNPVVVYVCR